LDNSINWVQKNLTISFTDEELLRCALTHRSGAAEHNERLEFLGDSVLQLVMSEWMYEEFPDASEGRLSRLRASLVKDATLADLATELELGDLIYLGPGERKSGGHRRSSILADAMEALFAAVYLDQGLQAARTAIRQVYAARVAGLQSGDDLRDPKTRLQEYLQGRQLGLPNYVVERVTGKAHRQAFEVACLHNELQMRAIGEGRSRRAAEQAAAESLLEQLEQTAK